MHLYPWKAIGPIPYEDFPNKDTKGFMCYPYFQVWKVDAKEMPFFQISPPTQFLFGARKRVMYHSKSFLKYLEDRPDCRYKAFEKDGHWLHVSSPDDVAREMKEFLL